MGKLMRTATIAVASIVVLSGLGAWYTGGRAEDLMREKIAKVNAQVRDAYGLDDAAGPMLELVQYERGIFSSQAKYRLNVAAVVAMLSNTEISPDQSTLEFSDQLEHGPFPWSRLKRLQLFPVMAFSQSALLPTPLTQPWFDLTQGQSPIYGETALAYSGQMDGLATLRAFESSVDGAQVKFSGLTSQFSANENSKSYTFDGNADSLNIAIKNNNVLLQGLSFKFQGKEGKFGVGLGNGFMQFKNFEITQDAKSVLSYQDWDTTSVATEDNDNIQAEVHQKIGNIKIGGVDFANFNLDIKVANMSGAAIKNIIELSKQENKNSAEYIDLIADQALGLLANKPVLEVGSNIKTSHGQGVVKLTVNLAKPDISLDALTANPVQAVEQVNLQVDISNAFIHDVLDTFIANMPKTRAVAPEVFKAQALSLIESTKAKLIAQKLIKAEGDHISLQINYKNNNVDWNGVLMPANMLPLVLMSIANPKESSFDSTDDEGDDDDWTEPEEEANTVN